MNENELSKIIIGACIEVHRELGPGLLESVYEHCLAHELSKLGLEVQRQIDLPVIYKGEKLNAGFRVDLLVNGIVILELKAVSELNDVHLAQMLTYLKFANCRLGLLINFNEAKLVSGIKRVVNKL